MATIAGREFAKALEAAGVVTDLNTVERIIIDVHDAMQPVRILVQRIGDDRLPSLAALLADDGERGVRYWMTVHKELLDEPPRWEDAGLRIVEFGAWEGAHARRVLFDDPGAPPELEGKDVEVIFKREGDGSLHIIERRPA